MNQTYSELIGQLEESAARLRAQNIQIGALDVTIAELKKHTTNIEAVEQNIDAVKDEVIAPIKQTLDQNRRAGQFSILGFWVGAVSIVLSTAGLVYSVYQARAGAALPVPTGAQAGRETVATAVADIRRDVNALTLRLLGVTSDYRPTQNEVLITTEGRLDGRSLVYEDKKELLASPSGTLVAQYRSAGEECLASGEYVPYVDLRLLLNGSEIGPTGQASMLTITRGKSAPLVDTQDFKIRASVTTDVRVYEGDVLTLLGKDSFNAVRVFRTSSRVLPVGDRFNGVLFRKAK